MLQVIAAQDFIAESEKPKKTAWNGYGLDPRVPPGAGSELDMSLLLDDHREVCHTVFLTSMFTTRGHSHGEVQPKPSFEDFESYYRSILSLPNGRAKALIFHDDLPEGLVRNYTTGDGMVSFVKVDISGYDPSLGPNDLRFKVFEEQVQKHPEWETIFMTDIQDVTVVHNPCALVDRNMEKLYVGSQASSKKTQKFMKIKFAKAGGKYLRWYNTMGNDVLPKLNPGIFGGKRPVVLKALRKVNEMLLDPERIAARTKKSLKDDMVAINYGAYTALGKENIITGAELHSKFGAREKRTDVYFWLK